MASLSQSRSPHLDLNSPFLEQLANLIFANDNPIALEPDMLILLILQIRNSPFSITNFPSNITFGLQMMTSKWVVAFVVPPRLELVPMPI